MSLSGALSIGSSALAASQAQLQVTGNNLANVANPNYARETATLNEGQYQEIQSGVYIGTGVDLTSIQRQVDDSLTQRVNSSTSDNQAATVAEQWSGQVQSVFNALGDNNLDTQLTTFQNDWSALANNPTDMSARNTVLQDGSNLSQTFNSVAGQLGSLQTAVGQQITDVASSANQLASQIAGLNQQIADAGGNDPGLLDQRDQAVNSLSQLINVQTVNQGNGTVNVYVGSEPLVIGNVSQGLTAQKSPTSTGASPTYQLVFTADNGNVQATGGQLGGLIASQTQINTVLQQLNTLAGGVINGVNNIYASGQGLTGYSSVTGTTQALSQTSALNSAAAGLNFPVQNGSFVVTLTNSQTGLSSSTLVPVNLTGAAGDTTLNSLTASLNAIPNLSATVTNGKLTIASTDPNDTITFSQDSSGALAALGINTFFQGSTAMDMAVNSTTAANPSLLAAAQNGNSGDNQTALAIANLNNVGQSTLGGATTQSYYSSMIGSIANTASQATNDATSTGDIVSTLTAQQQAISGVSINEETINMLQQQRAFQGAAQLVTTVNTLMTTLMAMIG